VHGLQFIQARIESQARSYANLKINIRVRIVNNMNKQNDHPELIAARLDEVMAEYGKQNRVKCNQTYLGKKSGVTQPTISRILKGRQKQGAELETIRRVADALGVCYPWLLEGIGPKWVADRLAVVHRLPTASPSTSRVAEAPIEMPRAIPMSMTGPHFLTPDEWLLVSYSRRTDDRGRVDLMSFAGDLHFILNPPAASNDPE